ncbi:MAG: hypothetical protein R3F21_10250 [Myxococcota bacterium]
MHSRRRFRAAWLCAAIVALACVSGGPARAHGPTVKVTATGFEPVLLNLFEGTTVHFTNAIAGSAPGAEGVVVSDEAGRFESPPITAAGDGWHYTFEERGTYVIRVAGRPEPTLRIVVVAKKTP